MSTMKYLLGFSCLLVTVLAEVKVGLFQNYAHGIGGEVYAKDEKTLVIKGFTYDGAGPDAFFWAGTSQAPSSVGTILPYPFAGKFYNYEDLSAPILSRRFNKEDIVLTLPEDLKASDIKWLSVWCRQFSVNFGDLFFPADLVLEHEHEDEDAIAEEDLPPPVIDNAHDPNRHDPDWKEDSDAVYAEAESEAEGEAEGSAISNAAYFQTLVILLIGAYLL